MIRRCGTWREPLIKIILVALGRKNFKSSETLFCDLMCSTFFYDITPRKISLHAIHPTVITRGVLNPFGCIKKIKNLIFKDCILFGLTNKA